MIIAFKCMSIDARIIISVLHKHIGKVLSGIGQIFYVKCHIFNDYGGPELPGSSHRREYS